MGVKVKGGEFATETYVVEKSSQVGAAIALSFAPAPTKDLLAILAGRNVDASVAVPLELHLVQIVREVPDDTSSTGERAADGNIGHQSRLVPDGPAKGWGVDAEWIVEGGPAYAVIAKDRAAWLQGEIKRLAAIAEPSDTEQKLLATLMWQSAIDAAKTAPPKTRKPKALSSLDPRYAQQRISPDIIPFTKRGTERAGNAAVIAAAGAKIGMESRPQLRDNPSVPIKTPILGMQFQVAALLDYGVAERRGSVYLGSVSWGWKRSSGGSDVKLDPLTLLSADGISAEFAAAVSHWNNIKVEDPEGLAKGQLSMMALPTA